MRRRWRRQRRADAADKHDAVASSSGDHKGDKPPATASSSTRRKRRRHRPTETAADLSAAASSSSDREGDKPPATASSRTRRRRRGHRPAETAAGHSAAAPSRSDHRNIHAAADPADTVVSSLPQPITLTINRKTYTLFKLIGDGSQGSCWMILNAMGKVRVVKFPAGPCRAVYAQTESAAASAAKPISNEGRALQAIFSGHEDEATISGPKQVMSRLFPSATIVSEDHESGTHTVTIKLTVQKQKFFHGEEYNLLQHKISWGEAGDAGNKSQRLKDIGEIGLRLTARLVELFYGSGIQHCDIKPENILIERDPDTGNIIAVHLVDYGLARFLSDGQVVEKQGSPFFIRLNDIGREQPPQRRLTGTSDVYALAFLLKMHLAKESLNTLLEKRKLLFFRYQTTTATSADKIDDDDMRMLHFSERRLTRLLALPEGASPEEKRLGDFLDGVITSGETNGVSPMDFLKGLLACYDDSDHDFPAIDYATRARKLAAQEATSIGDNFLDGNRHLDSLSAKLKQEILPRADLLPNERSYLERVLLIIQQSDPFDRTCELADQLEQACDRVLTDISDRMITTLVATTTQRRPVLRPPNAPGSDQMSRKAADRAGLFVAAAADTSPTSDDTLPRKAHAPGLFLPRTDNGVPASPPCSQASRQCRREVKHEDSADRATLVSSFG